MFIYLSSGQFFSAPAEISSEVIQKMFISLDLFDPLLGTYLIWFPSGRDALRPSCYLFSLVYSPFYS